MISTRRLVLLAVALLVPATLMTATPAGADQSESAVRRVAAASIAGGSDHTCVLLTSGNVRCWGDGSDGQLGYGNTNHIGDDETPHSAGNVPLGAKATAITADGNHTCALLTTGAVRCWGHGFSGRLGYGNTDHIGDDETPASAGNVPLGAKATAITAGGNHTCALLTTGNLRCWGHGGNGNLGYGNTVHIGDNETPASAGDVPLGAKATAITAGNVHTCALLTTGSLRCWGRGSSGRLGYGNTDTIGDDETPGSVGNVPLGAKATAITAGNVHTCAMLTTGSVRCWGHGFNGQLGYGNTNDIGDDETPTTAGNVPLGAKATAITAGSNHTCALIPTGNLRCWGMGGFGRLGYGNTNTIGDDETPDTAGNVPVGAKVRVRAATRTTVSAQPRRDRRAPYVYVAKGRVKGAFAVDAATCGGSVKVSAKKGTRTLATKRVGLRDDCTYRVKLEISAATLRTKNTVRLTIKAKYHGSTNLTPSRTTTQVRAN